MGTLHAARRVFVFEGGTLFDGDMHAPRSLVRIQFLIRIWTPEAAEWRRRWSLLATNSDMSPNHIDKEIEWRRQMVLVGYCRRKNPLVSFLKGQEFRTYSHSFVCIT